MLASHRRLRTLLVAAALAAATPGLAQEAREYPARPVRLVVPFSAGSSTDMLARIVAMKLNEAWGQPVVLENRPGGGGRLGAVLVAKATPDGYTLLWTSSAFTIAAAISADPPYHPLKDFAGVTRIGAGTNVLVVGPAPGFKSLQEFIAYAQARPGKIFLGSSGAGSATHLDGERFRIAADIKSVHVGFKGPPEFMIEIMAGRIHFGLGPLSVALPFIRDGKLLALAVGTPQRSPLLPDVPVITEVVPGYSRDVGGGGLLAPAGTPLAVRRKISREIARVLSLPEVSTRLQAIGYTPDTCTPEEHEQLLRHALESFTKVARVAGLRSP